MKVDSEMMMMGARSANQSPQSVASSGVDSGVDSLPDQLGDLAHVAISLCGGLTDNREITRGMLRKEQGDVVRRHRNNRHGALQHRQVMAHYTSETIGKA